MALEAEFKPRLFKALAFDGVDDYGVVPNTADLEFEQLTLEVWVKFYKLPMPFQQRIVEKGYEFTGGFRFAVYESSRGVCFQITSSEGKKELYTYALTANKYYHIVGTWDGETMRLYVNSEFIREGKCPDMAKDNGDIYLGTEFGTGRFLYGELALVRIYSIALSKSEIKYLYNNPLEIVELDNLVLYYAPGTIDLANSKWWSLTGKYHCNLYGCTEVVLAEKEVVIA